MNLADLLNATEATPKATNKKPKGYCNLTLAGVNVFSRPIWSDSTSETQFINELNDLMRDEPEKAEALMKQLLAKLEVNITVKQQSNASLADILGK